MELLARAEKSLIKSFDAASGQGAPPRLIAAMRDALFSGGARIRPQLCIAVAMACSEEEQALTDAAAASIEFMHCASLVHDDMPAFDNADTRRGRPSVHKAHGEPLALLTGDALIVMAFDVLMNAPSKHPRRVLALMQNLSAAVGVPRGLVAGQAWECEGTAELTTYQRAKTGSLFLAAVRAGALACGRNPDTWDDLGDCLGLAYQAADDIRDVIADPQWMGKPGGQDALLGRPNVMHELGLTDGLAYFNQLMDRAVASVPACPCRELLQQLVRLESQRLIPAELIDHARHLPIWASSSERGSSRASLGMRSIRA